VELNWEQAIDVRLAREALDRSQESTDYAGTCGVLEYHVRQLLVVVADLTGDRAGK